MLRTSPQYWYGRCAIGALLIVIAGTGRLPGPLAVILGIGGFILAMNSIGPMIRLLTREVHARRRWGDDANRTFLRASLPRRIYYLLAAVAQADGPMSQKEREAVRHFVLARFADPVHQGEFRAWEAQPFAVNDRSGLAARIATGLDDTEIDTLFCWCCLVAFSDGRFKPEEHTALQEVASGLGITKYRARMLFHLAKAQFQNPGQRGSRWSNNRQNGTGARPSVDERALAYETLGLPRTAKPEQIRRRHRELVKQFHPDRHSHLGDAAQREATERFHEIQRAYELLSKP